MYRYNISLVLCMLPRLDVFTYVVMSRERRAARIGSADAAADHRVPRRRWESDRVQFRGGGRWRTYGPGAAALRGWLRRAERRDGAGPGGCTAAATAQASAQNPPGADISARVMLELLKELRCGHVHAEWADCVGYTSDSNRGLGKTLNGYRQMTRKMEDDLEIIIRSYVARMR